MRDRRRAAGAGAFLVLLGWLATPSLAHAREDDDLALDLGGASAEPKSGEVDRGSRRLELRHVAAGKLTQGSPATEVGRDPDEATRNVTLTHAFWLGKTPVTRAQFARFVAETRHVTDAEKIQAGGMGWDPKTNSLVQKKEFSWRSPGFQQRDDEPVVLVTFGDANAFTAWASRKTGRRVRLPTEAEWEYAARAGTTTPWYGAAKEEDVLAVGWFRPNAMFATHPVGQKKSNPWGLFDMTGNVLQWCKDVYAAYPPGDATDPENATNTSTDPERRVLRGGSWLRDPKRGRSAARSKYPPGTRHADIGFRVAVDEDPVQPQGLGTMPGDVATGSPVGIASSASSPIIGADASAIAGALPATSRSSSEGFPWSLLFAPLASSSVVVAWVLARRGARSKVATPPVRDASPPPASRHPPHDASIDGFVGPPSTYVNTSSSARSVRGASSHVGPASHGGPTSRPPVSGPPAPGSSVAHSLPPSAPARPSAPPRNAIVDLRESQSPFLAQPEPASDPASGAKTARAHESANLRGAELRAFDAWMAAAKAEATTAAEARLTSAKALGSNIPFGGPTPDAPAEPKADAGGSSDDLLTLPGRREPARDVGRLPPAAEITDADLVAVATPPPVPSSKKILDETPLARRLSDSKVVELADPRPSSVPRPIDSRTSDPVKAAPSPIDDAADATVKVNALDSGKLPDE